MSGFPGRARPTIRTRLAWSYGLVILVTGLSAVLALSAVAVFAILERPPLMTLAPSAVLLHTLQPDPLGDEILPMDPAFREELAAYASLTFSAGDFDRLWAETTGRALATVAGLAGIAVVLIAVSSSYALAHRVSKPLSDLAATVHELSAANLGRRLDVPQSSDELGQLAASFNGMLDRLETSFRDLESATAYVSHELRTSLAVVRTQLEVGLSGARDLETAARQALAATDRAVEMVDQALALATRSIPEAAAPLDLALIVAQVVDDYSRPGRVIEFDLPPEGVPPVRGHATWLYRAVANLVGNAFKYGPPEGPVLIRVSRRYDAVLVEVQDRGTGIPAGELDLIWERFRRGSAASRSTGSPQEPGEAGRGYGLGLALVKQAVEAAGGMTWATSAEGCGSVFHLSFPVANRA